MDVKLVIYKDYTEMQGQRNIKVCNSKQLNDTHNAARFTSKTVRHPPFRLVSHNEVQRLPGGGSSTWRT